MVTRSPPDSASRRGDYPLRGMSSRKREVRVPLHTAHACSGTAVRFMDYNAYENTHGGRVGICIAVVSVTLRCRCSTSACFGPRHCPRLGQLLGRPIDVEFAGKHLPRVDRTEGLAFMEVTICCTSLNSSACRVFEDEGMDV